MMPNNSNIEPKTPAPAPQADPVIVLGDYTLDLFVYDRPDHAVQGESPSGPPLFTREAWQYARGYEARYCLGGAAAIQAMLHANTIPVIGNSLETELRFADPKPVGSVFILKKRPNTDAEGKIEERTYLSISDSTAKMISRSYTWRVDQGYLSAPDKHYTRPLAFDHLSPQALAKSRVVCLFDIKRGFHDLLFAAGDGMPSIADMLAAIPRDKVLVIRTSDPTRFARLLPPTGSVRCPVVFLCPLDELANDSLRTSGTWSDIWRHTYRYLSEISCLCSHKHSDWRYDVIIPIYQDGVLWFGPNQWSIDDQDRATSRSHREEERSTGRLFISPGAQPRLLEFEEPGLIIGTNLLITYAILRELASPGASNDFRSSIASGIERGFLRMRRFHNRGYCELSELTPAKVGWSSENVYILQPKEVWHDSFVERTDVLLKKRSTNNRKKGSKERRFVDDQLCGTYEIRFKIDASQLSKGVDVYRAMEKCVGGDFVASADASKRLASLLWPVEDRKKSWGLIGKRARGCVDTFVDREIGAFLVNRQISMRFGTFLIADPYATKPILDLSQRIRQHVFQNRYAAPEEGKVLSVALFGTPGSGKSHLAKEIARSIDPGGKIFARKEFNVSQFGGKEQLREAFADIAGSGLGGKVPLVLWDEFDSVLDGYRGGWLAQFLMPMQDAKYFDGQEDRWLGTAVFVFIGGTFPDTAEFRRWASEEAEDENGKPSESVILKGRDFHSRLFAALNMPSITYYAESRNFGESKSQGKRQQQLGRLDGNDYTRLARAVFLRELLLKRSKGHDRRVLEDVEPQMLHFLLNVPLRHGARSLERIVGACLVNRPDVLRRRHLPPTDFLAEHIETTNVALPGGETARSLDDLLSALLE